MYCDMKSRSSRKLCCDFAKTMQPTFWLALGRPGASATALGIGIHHGCELQTPATSVDDSS